MAVGKLTAKNDVDRGGEAEGLPVTMCVGDGTVDVVEGKGWFGELLNHVLVIILQD